MNEGFRGTTVTHRLTRPMSAGARVFHWTMVVMTLGLWWPIYLASQKAHGER